MATSKRLPGLPIRAKLTLRKPSPDGGVTPGDVYDLTEFDGYAVFVFVKPDRIIAQFSKNTVADYLDFKDTANEASGEVTIEIPGEKTKTLKEQMLYIIPVIQADDSGDPYPIGPDEGNAFELAYITTNPKDAIPDLG